MGLAAKIVCSAAIPVALVVGAAGATLLSLRDAGVEGSRAVARVAPVVREVATAEESLAALGRLHGRWLVIGGAPYERAWSERLDALTEQLAALRRSLETPAERRRVVKARYALDRYRDVVATDAGSFRPLAIAERQRANVAAERAHRAFDAIGHEVAQTSRRAEQRADSIARLASTRMAAAAVAAALLALVMAGLVGRRIVRGLAHLTDASVALERGRLDQAIPVQGRDELACLAGALETLASNLGERDRVNEDTIRRIGRELTQPLVTIRDAARALAIELAGSPASREQSRAVLIAESASELLRRVDHIGDDPLRAQALPAPDVPPVPLLEAPSRRLAEPASLEEDHA